MAVDIEQQRATSLVAPHHTNLASAMDLAATTLPTTLSWRVLLLSDRNENQGSSRIAAETLADRAIGYGFEYRLCSENSAKRCTSGKDSECRRGKRQR